MPRNQVRLALPKKGGVCVDDSVMDQVVDGEYGSAKEKSVAGQNAIRQLSQPVKSKLFVAQVLAFLSGVLAIAPYVALV